MTEGSEGASGEDAPRALMLDHHATTIATTLLISLLLVIAPVSAISFWDGNSLIHDSAEGIDYYTVPAPGYYNQSTISGASLAVNVDSGFNPYYAGKKLCRYYVRVSPDEGYWFEYLRPDWRYGSEGLAGQVMLTWGAYSDTSSSIPYSTFVDWLVAVYDLDPIVVQQNSVQLQAWFDAFTAGGAGQLNSEHYWDLNGEWFVDAGFYEPYVQYFPDGACNLTPGWPRGNYSCGHGLPIAGRSHTFGLYDNGLGWYHYFYTYQIGDTVSSGTYTYVIGNSAWEEYIADLQNQSSILPIFENLTDPCLLNMSTSGTPGSNPYVAFSFEPVNLATGNYVYQYQDLFIEGRGLPLAVTRSYNSLNPISGPFGSGWTFNYNVKLAGINGSEDVLVIREDGRTDVYNASSNGTYSPPPGVFDILTWNLDGSYTLERKDHITYLFTPTGQLVNIADTNGNTINLTYAGNNLTQVTDPSGRELTFTYDAAGRIISVTDPIGRILRYTYDVDDNLVRYTNPAGGNFDYTYDGNHWLTSITNPREIRIVTNTYDGDGRVISQSNALDAATTFSYDTKNRITTETDPLGRSTRYTYNDHFWELNETDALGNTISYAYDGNGNRISATDANGHTTTSSYDANGNIIQVTDPSGHSSTHTYDSKNNLLSSTDALGRQETFEYDANNNPVQITDTLGYITTFTYDQYGQVTHAEDANGHGTTKSYDTYGNPIDITDAVGNTETFSYDLVGRRVGATDARGETSSFSYDALDRLLSVTDPLGHSATYSYDGVGNRISSTDAMGSTTRYTYDPLNHLTEITDPLSGTVSYTYDAVDNLVSMTDANGHTTQYAYDPVHRLTAVTDPLGHITSYNYDAAGNTISSTDNNGDTTHLTYDSLNRLTGITYHDQTTVRYTYDAVGNRLAMTDSSGTTSYAYDGLNRLTGVTNSDDQLVTYGYDSVGNRIQMTYPDGRTVSYAYDNVDRLSGVTDWTGNMTSYGYDANSNLVNMAYPNGRETGYTYDDGNRLINLVNTDGASVVSGYEYTLDAVGNRLQVTEIGSGNSSVATAYEYDVLNRLHTVTYPGTTVTYTYDPMGNRLSMASTAGNTSSTISYTYDAGDRLLSAGTTAYTYDNNGNRIGMNEANGTTSYGYDAAGRLTGVSLPGSTSLTFAYDGDGNRVGKSVTSGNTTESTDYVWDVSAGLPQALIETDAQGTALSLYGLQRISTTGPAGGQTYYQYDGLGSVRGLSDSSGTTVSTYSYDAFGEPDVTTGFVDNDFLFTGEQMDPETGLIYLRARYYDPETGRFISKDPFTGFASVPPSLNRYTYGYNNPVRFTDPSGKAAWMAAVPGVAGAAVNDLWYMGEVIGTYAATGENTFSWCTLGGRTVGGCFGAYSGLGAGFVTKNPASAGAAWGAVEYPVDIGTQKVLSAIGVPGSTEEFSLEGLAVSAGGGAISGGAGKKIFSPNVRRNPKSFIKALNGREIQSEMKESLFGNIINKGLGIGVDSALEHIANGGK